MYFLPFLAFVYYPFQDAVFAATPDGYGRYLGIEGHWYKVGQFSMEICQEANT